MPDPTAPTPTPSPAMSTPHRATPKEWADQRHWAAGSASSCILELRDRVEALEAAALGRHGESAERAKPSPAVSLVDRVQDAIDKNCLDYFDHNTTMARAAIREVAEWLRSEYPRREGYGTAWANLIEEEADR